MDLAGERVSRGGRGGGGGGGGGEHELDFGAAAAWAAAAYGLLYVLHLVGLAATDVLAGRTGGDSGGGGGGGGMMVPNYYVDDSLGRWDHFPGQVAHHRTSEEKKKREEGLISGTLTEMVELSYWLVKMVGDFEKESGLRGVDPGGGLFGDNAASLVKLVRYAVKFVKSFEKLKKAS